MAKIKAGEQQVGSENSGRLSMGDWRRERKAKGKAIGVVAEAVRSPRGQGHIREIPPGPFYLSYKQS